MRLRGLAIAAALAVGSLLSPAAHACAVCYGDPDSSQVAGLNNAIWVLLSVVAVVQVGFVGMFVGFMRRARRRASGADVGTEGSQGVAE